MAFIKAHWRALLISLGAFAAVFAFMAYLFINGYMAGFMIDEQWISRDEFYDRAYHPEKYDDRSMGCYNHWNGLFMVNHCFTNDADLISFIDSLEA